jgi:ribosomal-protein-alanine N-acetyltransferase
MEDLDRIMAVMEAAFDPAWGEAWTRRQVSDSLAFPHTHYRLIDDEKGTAAGFTLVRAAPGEEELLLIAVRPASRGQGLGRQLLEAVLADARRRGAERVFLEMRYNNPAAALYSAIGFEPIGHRREYYRLPDGRKIDAITYGCPI